MLTDGFPCSIRAIVGRDVAARSATIAMGSLRRNRASLISAPSFLSALRVAGGGRCGVGITIPLSYIKRIQCNRKTSLSQQKDLMKFTGKAPPSLKRRYLVATVCNFSTDAIEESPRLHESLPRKFKHDSPDYGRSKSPAWVLITRSSVTIISTRLSRASVGKRSTSCIS